MPRHGQVPSLRFSLRCGVKFGGPTQSALYGAWCSGCLDYMKTDILIIRSKWHDKWAWPAFYFCFFFSFLVDTPGVLFYLLPAHGRSVFLGQGLEWCGPKCLYRLHFIFLSLYYKVYNNNNKGGCFRRGREQTSPRSSSGLVFQRGGDISAARCCCCCGEEAPK